MNTKIPYGIIAIISFLIIFFLGRNYVHYGSLLPSCRYTEKVIPVPQALSEGIIQTTMTSYIALGEDKEYTCPSIIRSANNEIVSTQIMDDVSIGKGYYESRGRKVVPFSPDKKLHVTGISEITMLKGATSGTHADYLIMTDEQGLVYKIATKNLGSDKNNLFLQFASPSRSQALERANFRASSGEPFVFGGQ